MLASPASSSSSSSAGGRGTGGAMATAVLAATATTATATGKQPRRWQRSLSPAAQAVAMCVVWYVSASAAVITSKTVLMHTWAPFTLSFTQFVLGAACGAAVAALREPGGVAALVVPAAQRRSVLRVATCFVSGFLCTNYAFDVMAASTVETVKTAQTVTSVLLAVLCSAASRDPFPAPLELACMVPIVAGVFLATYSDIDAVFAGVAAALVANVSFSLRGSMLKEHRFRFRKAAVGVTCLFFWSCMLGAVAAACAAAVHGENFDALEGQWAPQLQAVVDRAGRLDIGGSSATAGMPGAAGGGGGGDDDDEAAAVRAVDALSAGPPVDLGMVAVVVANGCLYWLYNFCSFSVLSSVTFLTHSALNACRRCVMIVVASFWFHRPVSLLNVLGISLAFGGFGLFLWAKHEAERYRKAHADADTYRKLRPRPRPSIVDV